MSISNSSGIVFWLTGLSGAGKTTIGRLLYGRLKDKYANSVFLDGDELREVFGNDHGHTIDDRRTSAMRNSRLCCMLSKQGIHVVCATISMFDECRTFNRTNIVNYREIYLEVPMEVLKDRDQKQLYSRAEAGLVSNVVGIDIEPEYPKSPDLVMRNDGSLEREAIVDRILAVSPILP